MKPETPFLEAIQANPNDVSCRLIFADWLEERGDARAAGIRAKCEFRLPITPKETRHFAAIAAARREATADQVDVVVDPNNPGHRLPGEDTANLVDDVCHLSRLEIARNFPREESGRLQLGRTVLLADYRCTEQLPRSRELWLVAEGPGRRSDPQRITIQLALLIGDNEVHNWSALRWWWDERRTHLGDKARWGITAAALRRVTGAGHDAELARLEARWRQETLDGPERILLCTMLQDRGRFEEALRVCNVAYPEHLSRMLNADRFKLPGGCCEPGTEESALARAARLRRTLWEAAPWRFEQALALAQARLDEWRSVRPGRSRKLPQMRFFILPKSSHHARKPGLMLIAGQNEQPELSFVFTASNVVLPESAWRRPVELDIARWRSAKS